MGENFRRKQAKSFKHRECAAYTARLAMADLLSGVKETAEVVDATCDLTDPTITPAPGTEVIVRACSATTADVIAGNYRIATLDLTSVGLERLFESGSLVIGVVKTLGEITPTINLAIPQPLERT